MDENRSVGLNSIINGTLWALALILLLSAWTSMIVGAHNVAVMLGITACVSTGIAMVFTIQCLAARNRALIRSLHGLNGGRPESLHTIS